ncbi:MAG: hypothetical protein ACYDAG_14665 [Chloroflexota bacterium]
MTDHHLGLGHRLHEIGGKEGIELGKLISDERLICHWGKSRFLDSIRKGWAST